MAQKEFTAETRRRREEDKITNMESAEVAEVTSVTRAIRDAPQPLQIESGFARLPFVIL
jgi:hypothetical protein